MTQRLKLKLGKQSLLLFIKNLMFNKTTSRLLYMLTMTVLTRSCVEGLILLHHDGLAN